MLKDSIIKTQSFFDIFDYPLTKEEIFSGLWGEKAVEFVPFIKELDELVSSGTIQEKWGLYFLPGKEAGVEKRRSAVPYVEAKLKKARRAAKIISYVPFLRAVFVCNSISFGMASKNSDIDFFIVSEKNRIWTVRLFTNLFLLIFGMRVGKRTADKICLSFYVDTNNLNLGRVAVGADDVYLSYWLKSLIPVYDPDDLHDKICKANEWAGKNVALNPKQVSFKEVESGKIGKMFKKTGEMFWSGGYGDLIESECKKIQLQKLKINKVVDGAKAPNVVIEDGMLKFHEKDIRADVYNKWKQKMSLRGV